VGTVSAEPELDRRTRETLEHLTEYVRKHVTAMGVSPDDAEHLSVTFEPEDVTPEPPPATWLEGFLLAGSISVSKQRAQARRDERDRVSVPFSGPHQDDCPCAPCRLNLL
jgi:hypothetical protein